MTCMRNISIEHMLGVGLVGAGSVLALASTPAPGAGARVLVHALSASLDTVSGLVLPMILLGFLASLAGTEARIGARPRRTYGAIWGLSIVAFAGALTSIWVAASVRTVDEDKRDRLRKALLLDAGAAPVAMLLYMNLWGLFVMDILAKQGADDPAGLLFSATLSNAYPIAVVALALALATYWDRQRGARETSLLVGALASIPSDFATYLLVLAVTAIANSSVGAPLGFYDLIVLSLIASTVVAAVRHTLEGTAKLHATCVEALRRAVGPLALIACGLYFANVLMAGHLEFLVPVSDQPVAMFASAALVGGLTGSSWATIAVLVPTTVGMHTEPVVLGAILSGAILGDHASPWSDTTIVAASAAGVTASEHARYQALFCAVAASIATLYFLFVGTGAGT